MKFLNWVGEHPVLSIVLVIVLSDAAVGIVKAFLN